MKSNDMKDPIAAVTPQPRPAANPAGARKKTFSLVGAGIGVITFLAIALLPSLVYGGAASVQLASGIFEASGAPTIGISVFIVLGMVLAVTAAGSLFVALGAVAGASVGALTRSRRLALQ